MSEQLKELEKISRILMLAYAKEIEIELSKFASTDERKKIWVLIDGQNMPKDMAKLAGNVKVRAIERFLKQLAKAKLIENPSRKPPSKLIDYVPGEDNFSVVDDSKLNEQQKNGLNFIKGNILDKYSTTGVQQVLDKVVFDLIKYIAVYPVATNKLTDKDGNVLPDCFIVPSGITALDFAYKIHSDIGDSFIRAVDLKTKQVIGKEHPLKNRDVVEIVAGK